MISLANFDELTHDDKIDQIAKLETAQRKLEIIKAIQEQHKEKLYCFLLEYLESENQTTSDGMKSTYKTNLNRFLGYAFDNGLVLATITDNKKDKLITYNQAKQYRKHLQKPVTVTKHKWKSKRDGKKVIKVKVDAGTFDQVLSPRSINQNLSTVRQFFDMLQDSDLVPMNVFTSVKGLRKNANVADTVKAYSVSDLKTLLNVCNPELQLIILLGAHGGLRVSEMVNLEWHNIDLRNREMTLVKTKSGRNRTIQITPQLNEYLLKQHTPDITGHVLKLYRDRFSINKDFAKSCKALGIQSKGVHGLRHTCGLEMLKTGKGKNLQSVQKHLGHSSLQMAQIYANISNDLVAADVMELPTL